MILRNKHILIISPEPWDHLFVSKHHYAIHLAKRSNSIIFLNPPAKHWRVYEVGYRNLKVVDHPGFWKGLRYLPRFIRKMNQLIIFSKIENLTETRFDIIWSFDNSVFFDFDSFPNTVLKISHIVDLGMDFQFSRASSTANICLASTTRILKKHLKYNSEAHFINHGYNHNRSTKLIIPSAKSLKIGYAGNLDIEYIDWDTIEKVVSEHNKLSFFFAGSGRQRLPYRNIHYLGKLSIKELGSFYQQMDILILVYKADQYMGQLANPHKILEYLGSGKPIISTYTEEYANKDLIYMTKENKDWPKLFKDVLKEFPKYASDELVTKRKAYALDNSYDKQIDRIERILANYE